MCNSMIFVAKTTPTTALASGSTIPLGTIGRKFGCNCNLLGDEIQLNGKGYYDVNATVSITPSAVGNITVQLYKDGVAVPGALATFYASVTETVPIVGVVRMSCCDVDGKLSLRVTTTTGVTATIENVAIEVKKI